MRSAFILWLFLAVPVALAEPSNPESVTFQLRDSDGHIRATHIVVPPRDAADLSPTELLERVAPAGDGVIKASFYWLGVVYRYDASSMSLKEVFRGSLGKHSKFRVRDLHPGDIVLFHMESY